MNRRSLLNLSATVVIVWASLSGSAIAQQAGPTLHKYLNRAVLTAEGVKNLHKQPPTALRAAVAKSVESVGGKLEVWYFDYGTTTAWSIIDYPDEISAAAAQMTTNAAAFAHVTLMPLMTAEDADKALAKITTPPQQQ